MEGEGIQSRMVTRKRSLVLGHLCLGPGLRGSRARHVRVSPSLCEREAVDLREACAGKAFFFPFKSYNTSDKLPGPLGGRERR